MKIYDSREISAILRKATESSSAGDPDGPLGLSIDELRQLATDVGIDPDRITSAVAEIEMGSGRSERTFWGGPFSYNSQILTEGEISAGQWEEMLISIRNFFQSKGDVSTRESVLEWSSPWGTTNSAQVTALKLDGKTRISVSWNGPLTAVPFYAPVPLVAIGALFFASEFLLLTAVPGIAFTVFAAGLALLAGRWALHRHLDKGFIKLRQMVKGLEDIASVSAPDSETVLKQANVNPAQSDIKNPGIELHEKENHDSQDSETNRRNRSKT